MSATNLFRKKTPKARITDPSRRKFLKGAAAGGGAAALGVSQIATAQDPSAPTKNHYYVRAMPETVHWGYFSKILKPLVTVDSGDFVTLETLTHHANDDFERMIKGDKGAESVFHWDKNKKGVNKRGAGPMDHKSRRRRGLWRAHLYRPDRRERRGAGRYSRSAHHRRATATERKLIIQRQKFW